MEKLKQLSRSQLNEQYYNTFGYETTAPNDYLIAALYYGKRAESLTQEELNEIAEY